MDRPTRIKRPYVKREPRLGRYEVPAPDSSQWPAETYCMNVMCRAKFKRQFGESEFCPACRKMLRKG